MLVLAAILSLDLIDGGTVALPDDVLLGARVNLDGNATIERHDWSPDGRWFAYSIDEWPNTWNESAPLDGRTNSLCVFDRETGSVRVVYQGRFCQEVREPPARREVLQGVDHRPVYVRWSPDGQCLMFFTARFLGASINADGNPLLDVDPATGDKRILSDDYKSEDGTTMLSMMYERTVSFSPDGRSLLLVQGPGRFMAEDKRIALLDYGSLKRKWLTDAETASFDAAWSTDGRKIVYASSPEKALAGDLRAKWCATRIWVMDKNGFHKRKITRGVPGYFDVEPGWLDEDTIRFVRIGADDWSRSNWKVDLDGTGLRKISDRSKR